MKIIGISGSPRKGNTEFMVKTCLEACKKAGAETELILLRQKKIRHCDGCDSCYETGKGCHIKDDMQKVYKSLFNSETWVLGSPNYFKNVSGLMKDFIDRTNAYCNPPKFKNKKIGIICVGGQSLYNIHFCENIFKEFIKDHKMKLIGSVMAKANEPREVAKNKKVIKKLQDLGEKLVKSIKTK